MSNPQAIHIEATLPAATTYNPGTRTLSPNDVTYINKTTTDEVVISLSTATGSITAVSSVPVLTWTQAPTSGEWVSSGLPMPALDDSTPVNLTISIDAEAGHDPTFTVNNKKRG